MRSRMMIGVGVALALTACEQTEVREITEDRYLPQSMDTVKITDNYYETAIYHVRGRGYR